MWATVLKSHHEDGKGVEELADLAMYVYITGLKSSQRNCPQQARMVPHLNELNHPPNLHNARLQNFVPVYLMGKENRRRCKCLLTGQTDRNMTNSRVKTTTNDRHCYNNKSIHHLTARLCPRSRCPKCIRTIICTFAKLNSRAPPAFSSRQPFVVNCDG